MYGSRLSRVVIAFDIIMSFIMATNADYKKKNNLGAYTTQKDVMNGEVLMLVSSTVFAAIAEYVERTLNHEPLV